MPITILIADDYDDNRELLRLLLQAANYSVIEARDGFECVQSAREHLPDLNHGRFGQCRSWMVGKFFRTLKADPATAHIPFVAVTAHGSQRDCERALRDGFNAFGPKAIQHRRNVGDRRRTW